MTLYTCTVKIEFDGNDHECSSQDDYIDLVIEQYEDLYNIKLHPDEIYDISPMEEN